MMNDDDNSTMLRDSVARALGDVVSPRGTVEAERDGIDRAAWSQLRHLGLLDDEAAELPLPELAAILDEIGYAGALVPYADSVLLAGWLARGAGFDRGDESLLSLASLPAAALEPGSGAAGGAASLRRQRVAWGRHVRDVLLIFASEQRHWVARVPAAALGLTPGSNLAGEPLDPCSADRIAFDAASVRELDPEHDPWALRLRGAFCRTAAMLGSARRVQELTLQYALDRKQFGKSLSQFQTIQSHLAEMAGEVAAAGAMLESVLSAAASPKGLLGAAPELAAVKVRVGMAAHRLTALAHQIHGAIGFTQEHSLHLYTRRLWAWREEYGNAAEWSQWLGNEMASLGSYGFWQRITR